jgi:hypothetical protein
MSAKEEKMVRELAERLQPIKDKIAELDQQIDDLTRKLGEATTARKCLRDVYASMGGPPIGDDFGTETTRRTRIPNVKGTVLDIMARAGSTGRTSIEVLTEASHRSPGVSRDTISSVLSRLKSDGALRYDGMRYFDAKIASASPDPAKPAPLFRAVS